MIFALSANIINPFCPADIRNPLRCLFITSITIEVKYPIIQRGFKPHPDLKPASLIILLLPEDRNLLLVSAFSLKTYNSVNQMRTGYHHRRVPTFTTRMNLCATLSVQDVSSLYKLSVCSLRAKSLGLGISAVLSRTNSLFMSEKLKVHL